MSESRARFNVVMTSNRYNRDMSPEHRVIEQFPDLGIDLVDLRGVTVASEADIIAKCQDADALLCSTIEAITADVLNGLPRLKVVGRYGVGIDNIDLDAATARDVVITHYPQYCTAEVADHALALILALNRRLVEFDRDLRQGAWVSKRFETRQILHHPIPPLRELTLGIVGFGRIGREVAKRTAPFGLTLLASDPYVSHDEIRELGAEPVGLDDLLARSDIVTVHCPLSPETRGLIGHDQLAKMKTGALLVNTARGPILDLDAVAEALRTGKLGGAGLDVVYPEPLPVNSPLYGLPNVILTPHAAYYSERSVETVRNETLRQTLLVLQGRRPSTVANPAVLERVLLV